MTQPPPGGGDPNKAFPFAPPPSSEAIPTPPTPDYIPPYEDSRLRPVSDDRIPLAVDVGGRAAEAEAWTGKYIGPYRVERALSRGGMGLVLLANDEALRRKVALKLMDTALVSDEDALKRFEREARAAAAVSHRHIAQVYLVGLADNGQPFLAMEYIDGGSLMQVIRNRTPISFTQISAWMEQVASALQAAKRLNIIHRDIKPANIMINTAGEAKVVDFGLAKIFFEDSYMTQEGMVLGTPSYMAPEQGQGRTVDHRADIYAFGAMFYHIITGRPPFTAESHVQIMMKHVMSPLVPMRTINHQVPIEFDEIIGRCMRKDQDERYQDYEALLGDIKRVRLQSSTREHGAVVGNEAGAVPHIHSGPSGAFPAPPSMAAQRGGLSAPPQGVAVRHAAGVVPYDQQVEEPSGWTPAKIGMVAGAGLLAVAVVAMMIFGGGDGTESAAPSEPPTRSPLLRLRDRGEPKGPNDYDAYTGTVEMLQNLGGAMVRFEAMEGRLPFTLKEVAKEEFVVMSFATDDDGNPLDGWGTPVGFRRDDRAIYSTGIDRSPHTQDDLSIAIDNSSVEVPAKYLDLRPPTIN